MRGISTLTTPGHVYFIRATKTGMVKIGWATKPEERLKLLQAASPDALYIVATKPGNGRDEKMLHKRFMDARIHGEWFEPVPELLAMIKAVRAAKHEPYRPARESVVIEPRRQRKRRPKREVSGPPWPPPQSYWDCDNHGWERLRRAANALG